MDLFIIFLVVVSQVHAYCQTHKIVYIKNMQFFNLSSAVKKKQNTSLVDNKTFLFPHDCLAQATAVLFWNGKHQVPGWWRGRGLECVVEGEWFGRWGPEQGC